MTFKSIEEIFEAFRALKVLILGDVMLDTYIYGTVSRISPEAPVPVVNVKKRESRPGGAGNVALNIQALGATPILCSVMGDDSDADTFIKLLKKQGISDRGIIKSEERITTVKNRILSASQHLLRIDSEIDEPLSPAVKQVYLDRIINLVRDVDLIIFEDYDKGCLDQELIAAVIRLARQRNIPTAVDPKKRNFLQYHGCSLFKPNLKELKEGLREEIDPSVPDQLQLSMQKLKDRMKYDQAIVTLSERGIFYNNEETSGIHKAHIRSVADVSGAGDTVISVSGLCLALNLPLSFIAELSNLAGGIVCEYQGVLPIEMQRLKIEAANNRILVEQLG